MARPSKAEKPPAPSGSTALILSGSSASPLSAEQKRFNRLLTEIDRLRRRIESTRTELEDLTRFALAEAYPLELDQARAAGDLARALYQTMKAMRADPKRRQRVPRSLEDYIIELLQDGLRVDLPDPHPDLPKIYKELTGTSVESSRQADFNLLRAQMEDQFRASGIDVDLSDFDVNLPPAQASERLARLMAEAKERKQRLDSEGTGGFASDASGAASGARGRAGKAADNPAAADGDVREEITLLYRHLAKLLHPDLEQDPALRAGKEAAMKEVTLAYKANDLLTLLRIEVEWVRGDATRVAGMDEDRLARCNAMLSAQAKQLKQDLKDLPADPKYGPASTLAHPVFGFEGFSRPGCLKSFRSEIEKRQQWVQELNEGKDPEAVFSQLPTDEAGYDLFEKVISELNSPLPPRRRRRGR
jgi:hypothetical protein